MGDFRQPYSTMLFPLLERLPKMIIISNPSHLTLHLGQDPKSWAEQYTNCKIGVCPEFVSVTPFVENADKETHTKENLYFPFTSKQFDTLVDIAERTAINYEPAEWDDIDPHWSPTFAPFVYNQPSTPIEEIKAVQGFKIFVSDGKTKILDSSADNMFHAQRLLEVLVMRYLTVVSKSYLYGNTNVDDIKSPNQFKDTKEALLFLKDRLRLEIFIENPYT